MENHGPGRPKKKLREEYWRQKWYDAAESESYSSIGVWESYEAAIINHHTADEYSRALILTKEFHATYTAEKVLTAAMKLNSALSVFLDTYVRHVPFG